jgi:hypothetical protein
MMAIFAPEADASTLDLDVFVINTALQQPSAPYMFQACWVVTCLVQVHCNSSDH